MTLDDAQENLDFARRQLRLARRIWRFAWINTACVGVSSVFIALSGVFEAQPHGDRIAAGVILFLVFLLLAIAAITIRVDLVAHFEVKVHERQLAFNKACREVM